MRDQVGRNDLCIRFEQGHELITALASIQGNSSAPGSSSASISRALRRMVEIVPLDISPMFGELLSAATT
jgi:hypothetical protein